MHTRFNFKVCIPNKIYILGKNGKLCNNNVWNINNKVAMCNKITNIRYQADQRTVTFAIYGKIFK